MGGGGGDGVDLGYWDQAIGRSFHRERDEVYGVPAVMDAFWCYWDGMIRIVGITG